MNLRQLQYLVAMTRNDFNMTATAAALYTSQSGISKQISLLEKELQVILFERRGRQINGLTPAGEAVLAQAERALIELESLNRAAQEYSDPNQGDLAMAMTHTLARHAFPPVVEAFGQRYPAVKIHFHLATPSQIAELVNNGTAQFGIATEVISQFEDLIALPAYRWRRAIITPKNHPLSRIKPITLADLTPFPIATYTFGFNPGAPLDTAFRSQSLTPNIRFTATDADVIKTYVRMGFGVGIVAALAYDKQLDSDLVCLDASALFEVSTAYIVLRRGSFLRRYMFDFLELFAPHLNESSVKHAINLKIDSQIANYFSSTELPVF